jgi:hypothetical protein
MWMLVGLSGLAEMSVTDWLVVIGGWLPFGSYHGSPSGRSNPVNRTKEAPG